MPRRAKLDIPRQDGPLEILWGYAWRIALGWWLMLQTIGFFFWGVWQLMNDPAREFWFGPYVAYWEKWGDFIMMDVTPSFLHWIWSLPTWQDPIGWILIAFAGYRLMKRLGRKETPSLN